MMIVGSIGFLAHNLLFPYEIEQISELHILWTKLSKCVKYFSCVLSGWNGANMPARSLPSSNDFLRCKSWWGGRRRDREWWGNTKIWGIPISTKISKYAMPKYAKIYYNHRFRLFSFCTAFEILMWNFLKCLCWLKYQPVIWCEESWLKMCQIYFKYLIILFCFAIKVW